MNRERDLLGDAWGVGGCGGCGELGGPGHGARVLDGDGPGGGEQRGGGGAGSDWDGPTLGKSIIWKNYEKFSLSKLIKHPAISR